MSSPPPDPTPDAAVPFLWGVATSSTQTDGAGPLSTWGAFERAGRAPESGTGNGFATNARDDLGQLTELGLTQFRTSLDWSRLEPTAGRHDGDAIERARDQLIVARDLGMDTWVCLQHISSPGWFADDEGGFLNGRSRSYFWARHVDWAAETFGDLVDGWIPVHEPVAQARGGWLGGSYPPGRNDDEGFAHAVEALLLAQHDAWRLLRSGDQPVATAFDIGPIHPGVHSNDDRERIAANDAAELVDRTVWNTGIRFVTDGILSVPGRSEIVIEDAAESFDLIGFTYRGASSVYADFGHGPYPADLAAGPDGFAAWPEGLGLTIRRLADAVGKRPLLITGISLALDARDDDDRQRVEYLDACFAQIADARAEGIDLRGVFLSSPIDSYEWNFGHGVRRGFIDRDRAPKPSAELIRRWTSR